MPLPRILLVEDDAALVALVRDYLSERGFAVRSEGRGDRAVGRVRDEKPDLVVLDLGLPGEDGLSVCKRLREFYLGPILVLTARDSSRDEIAGLEAGADDYIAKPVRPSVLVARLNALLRRASGAVVSDRTKAGSAARALAVEGPIKVGDLVVDGHAREARLADVPLVLTSGEFDLLWQLALRAGEVVSREALLESLRGESYDGYDRSIDVRVSKLRQKLGAAAGMVKTVRGTGYQLAKAGV